ncbi:MAG: hypothetical protein KC620_16200 [Myxococcales bacterium]|nr:hypothetical protein [Myxococcales bacterium]
MSARFLIAALLLGCAAGGDPGSGGEDLPNRGFAPYERVVDADEKPIAALEAAEGETLGGPMAWVVDGRVRLFVDRCDDAGCAIAYADSADGLSFGALQTALRADFDLSAPFVTREPGGVALYAVRGDGEAIVRAAGDGAMFSNPQVVLEAPARMKLGSPSVAGDWLFFALIAEDGASALARAPRGGGAIETLTVPGVEEGWAPPGIEDPEVRLAESGAGRTLYRLAFAGRAGGRDADIGFAAAFDGAAFLPFRFNPSLSDSEEEAAPTCARLGDRFLLYVSRGTRRQRVIVAVNEAGQPSEAF